MPTTKWAATASWAQYQETRNPQFIFSFAGDPALARSLRDAWPGRDVEYSAILDTLEETLAINRLWVEGQGSASNERHRQPRPRAGCHAIPRTTNVGFAAFLL